MDLKEDQTYDELSKALSGTLESQYQELITVNEDIDKSYKELMKCQDIVRLLRSNKALKNVR